MDADLYQRLFDKLVKFFGEDLAQEAILRTWQALQNGTVIPYPASYAYRAAANLKVDSLRRDPKLKDGRTLTYEGQGSEAPTQLDRVLLREVLERCPELVEDQLGPVHTLSKSTRSRLRTRLESDLGEPTRQPLRKAGPGRAGKSGRARAGK